jgi:hypothetical protein
MNNKNNMNNIYTSFDSTALRMLDTVSSVAKPHPAVALQAQPRPVRLQSALPSLTVMVRNLRSDRQGEDLVWFALVGSAVILLALSLWL